MLIKSLKIRLYDVLVETEDGDLVDRIIAGTLIALIVVLGIGLFALPTGILASGFTEQIELKKAKNLMFCPYCGKEINSDHISKP